MPRFVWNDSAARFTDANGRSVANEKVRGALDDYLDAKSAAAREVSQQLQRREISIGDWQDHMSREVTKNALNAAALARGGAARLDDAALAKTGAFVQSELAYLDKFALGIERGLPLDGRFLNRTRMFMQAARTHFHAAQRDEMGARGVEEERSIRHARDSCDDCVYWEGVSWQPIGTVDLLGDRECSRNCKCILEYRGRNYVESYARVQEDKRRAANELPAKEEAEKPFTLRSKLEKWGKGFVAPDGKFVIPRRAVNKVKAHTRHNAREVSFLFDLNTGAAVDFQIGNKYRVEWDAEVYRRYDNLLIIHPHSDVSYPSQADWSAALYESHFRQFIVIGKEQVFEFERPDGWRRPLGADPNVRERFDFISQSVYRRQLNLGLSREEAILEAGRITNGLMQNEYGVPLKVTPREEWLRDMNAKRSKK